MSRVILIISMLGFHVLYSQEAPYFPPLNSDDWEHLSLEQAEWCTADTSALYQALEDNGTRAFLALKNGRIVIEKYFDGFHKDSSWIWFSAGKSLTAFLTGLAQEQGCLDIEASSNTYLGNAWSSLEMEQESAIKVHHHLSMTTGLDYTVPDPFCTDRECLEFLNTPGSHWYYHNAPYSLVRTILENACDRNINVFTVLALHTAIGMDGLWVPVGFNNFFVSTPRSMARFGLLMLNQGDWDGATIMADKAYLRNMTESSQQHNPSYGYLWWLNGKSAYKLPGSDFVFQGPLVPEAPMDMYCAVGANGQILYIVPSQNLVVVRMGGTGDSDDLVPVHIVREIAGHLDNIICQTSQTVETDVARPENYKVYPNPLTGETINIESKNGRSFEYELVDPAGRIHQAGRCDEGQQQITLRSEPGMYYLRLIDSNGIIGIKKLLRYK